MVYLLSGKDMNKDPEIILGNLKLVTILSCLVIALVALGFFIYIKRKEDDHKHLLARKQWIEQMPTVVSTLGVLGTFLGITLGLLHFDTENLDASIPLLLSGLKTAFLTSLLGMVGSLLLNRVVNRAMDKADNKEGERHRQVETMNALSNMISAIDGEDAKKLKTRLMDTLDKINGNVSDAKVYLQGIHSDISQVKDDIEEIRGHCEEMKNAITNIGAPENGDIPQLLAVVSTTAASIAKIDNDMEAFKESSSSIKDMVLSISSDVEDLKQQ